MRRCSKCQEDKPLEAFIRDKRNPSGRGSYCLPCNRIRQGKVQADYRLRHPNVDVEYMAERRKDAAFKEAEKTKARDWYAENREEQRARKREVYYRRKFVGKAWAEANRHKMRAIYARYRAAKANACPVWADMQAILSVYGEARKISAETGEIFHVDHIVPLQGENVCGLHVHWNLQILPASENQSKGNKLIEAVALAA